MDYWSFLFQSGVVVSGHLSSDLRLLSLMVTVAREDANRKDAFLICVSITVYNKLNPPVTDPDFYVPHKLIEISLTRCK